MPTLASERANSTTLFNGLFLTARRVGELCLTQNDSALNCDAPPDWPTCRSVYRFQKREKKKSEVMSSCMLCWQVSVKPNHSPAHKYARLYTWKPTAACAHTHTRARRVCATIISSWKQPQRAKPTFFPEPPAPFLQASDAAGVAGVHVRRLPETDSGTCTVCRCSWRREKSRTIFFFFFCKKFLPQSCDYQFLGMERPVWKAQNNEMKHNNSSMFCNVTPLTPPSLSPLFYCVCE